jgi:CO/xanthine dehydrogenase Mo-binding subunit
MSEPERICVSQFLMPVVRDVPDTGKAFVIGFPHLFYAHAAHVACVEVDELTGAVDVKAYLAATEAGCVINPQGFEQQVQGAVAQGIGYALSEEVKLEKGRVLTPDLATYIIPSAPDIPEMISLAVETEEPTGPYGMKGVGEVGTNAPLPAIAGAVARACGIEGLRRAPLTAERILEALRRKYALCGDEEE